MNNDRPDQDPRDEADAHAPEANNGRPGPSESPETAEPDGDDGDLDDNASDRALAAETEDVLGPREEKLTFAESDRDPRAEDFAAAPAAIAASATTRSTTGEPASRRSLSSLLFAAVVGGVIATVLGIAYHASGLVPTRSEALAQDAIDRINGLGKTVAALGQRVDAIEADQNETGIDGLSDRIARLESVVGDNGGRLDDLEKQGADGGGVDNASADDLAAIEAELTTLKSRVAALDPLPGTVSQLGDRLTTIDTSVKSLDGRVQALSEAPIEETLKAVKVIAVGVLQQGAASGEDFAADVAMAKALGLSGGDVDELAALAVKGVPTVAALQAEFPSVADAIIAAESGLSEDAGFFDQLTAVGSNLVTVRPAGTLDGESVEAILSRMSAAVSAGDLAGALSERQSLPEAGQAASAAWAGAASDRMTIDKLVAKLAQSVSNSAN